MPVADEDVIRLTARLYECRDSARTLFGARYAEVLQPWKDIVRAAMKKYRCSALRAPLKIAQEAKAGGQPLEGDAIFMLLAAAVEVTEADRS